MSSIYSSLVNGTTISLKMFKLNHCRVKSTFFKHVLYLQVQTKEMKFNRQATLHQLFSFISKYKEEVVIFCNRSHMMEGVNVLTFFRKYFSHLVLDQLKWFFYSFEFQTRSYRIHIIFNCYFVLIITTASELDWGICIFMKYDNYTTWNDTGQMHIRKQLYIAGK